MTIECDALWSFVCSKDTKQWIWLALDRDTREMVGVAIGARGEATARELWASLSPVYRQCAVCSSDFWEAYACVLPSKRHRPVGKEREQTSHIESPEQHAAAAHQSPGVQLVLCHTARADSVSVLLRVMWTTLVEVGIDKYTSEEQQAAKANQKALRGFLWAFAGLIGLVMMLALFFEVLSRT